MKKIAVIGSGTMGTGIAHTMAQYGLKVCLIDLNEKILASRGSAKLFLHEISQDSPDLSSLTYDFKPSKFDTTIGFSNK